MLSIGPGICEGEKEERRWRSDESDNICVPSDRHIYFLWSEKFSLPSNFPLNRRRRQTRDVKINPKRNKSEPVRRSGRCVCVDMTRPSTSDDVVWRNIKTLYKHISHPHKSFLTFEFSRGFSAAVVFCEWKFSMWSFDAQRPRPDAISAVGVYITPRYFPRKLINSWSCRLKAWRVN